MPAARTSAGRAFGDDRAAGVAAFGAEVDEPVGGGDDVEVVLDDDDRVPRRDEAVERRDELRDVGEVQARRRLVEEEQRAALRAGVGELGRELQPLRLAARQRRHRLPQRQVLEPDVDERLQPLAHGGVLREVVERLGDRHLEHVGDRLRLAPARARASPRAPRCGSGGRCTRRSAGRRRSRTASRRARSRCPSTRGSGRCRC